MGEIEIRMAMGRIKNFRIFGGENIMVWDGIEVRSWSASVLNNLGK